MCQGSRSDDVVFTLPGLISLLSPRYRSSTIENNINVKPGTSGKIGNGWRNWSYFSPPVEVLDDDPMIKKALFAVGKRSHHQFDHFRVLEINEPEECHLTVLYSIPQGRQIVYSNHESLWQILPLDDEVIGSINVELIAGNEGDTEIWHHINLESVIDLENDYTYNFQDLNGSRECYTYPTAQIKRDGLFVKLQPGQVHHFLVYEENSIQTIEIPDR
jgi:hypothetical protein